MRLPRDLISNTYVKPRVFLCEVDKQRICQLDTTNLNGSFKFNSLSEISFEVARNYNDLLQGRNFVNPYYDKIEALRLIYLEGFGYFELQAPELSSEGIKESKNCTAYSSEYALAHKYLNNFYINTGEVMSVEVAYAEQKHGVADHTTVKPVVLYDQDNQELSLLHLALKEVYGWEIGYVDPSLATLSRTFEVERESVYDFLMNEVCEQFNCYIVFDTINNKINVYAESQSQKFMGDGVTQDFLVSPAFAELSSVSVGGYKTTEYNYDPSTGQIVFDKAPGGNEVIEIIDGALSAWETDVFITFDNLAKEININYEADDIKTMLSVYGADKLDIREVNMGLPYMIDISYYCTPDWLGADLYDAYTQYLKEYNAQQKNYKNNAQQINEIDAKILHEQNRMSSSDIEIVVKQQNVTATTVGNYFVRGGDYPYYYYKEVTLPDEHNANEIYYLFENEGINLTETDVTALYEALQDYFQAYFVDKTINTETLKNAKASFSFIAEVFDTMCTSLDAISTFITPTEIVKGDIESTDNTFIFASVNKFLDKMWEQLGSVPLKYCYQDTYIKLQQTAMEAGWGEVTNAKYGRYFAVYLMVKSIERALAVRNKTIDALTERMQGLQNKNADITSSLDISTYFKNNYPAQHKQFMLRLSAFLREDEYTDDNFIVTGQETLDELYQLKQQLKECGKIELNRLCSPKLQFSMTMANIYALPEFAPIVDQFQLGNVIKVGLRSDYKKQSRLLQVDINFEDFSDFSVEFGELTKLYTQSDIHADLLANAISAGKTVASNKSHWDKGTDTANSIDLRIQRGLLDAATSIKSMDATQNVEIDNYGIHLRKKMDNDEYDPEQGWITNNKFLYSNDGFKTVNSVFGKYSIDGEDYWGLLANAVIAGYIEGSKIKGGTIQIGEYVDDNGTTRYAFEVHEDGTVTMGGDGGHTIDGYATTNTVQKIQGQVDDIEANKMYRVEITTADSLIISKDTDVATLTCKVYSWDTDITDDLDETLFSWKRTSTDKIIDEESGLTGDEIWNNRPEHQNTKSITIGATDVIENSSFTCEVNLP